MRSTVQQLQRLSKEDLRNTPRTTALSIRTTVQVVYNSHCDISQVSLEPPNIILGASDVQQRDTCHINSVSLLLCVCAYLCVMVLVSFSSSRKSALACTSFSCMQSLNSLSRFCQQQQIHAHIELTLAVMQCCNGGGTSINSGLNLLLYYYSLSLYVRWLGDELLWSSRKHAFIL